MTPLPTLPHAIPRHAEILDTPPPDFEESPGEAIRRNRRKWACLK